MEISSAWYLAFFVCVVISLLLPYTISTVSVLLMWFFSRLKLVKTTLRLN